MNPREPEYTTAEEIWLLQTEIWLSETAVLMTGRNSSGQWEEREPVVQRTRANIEHRRETGMDWIERTVWLKMDRDKGLT